MLDLHAIISSLPELNFNEKLALRDALDAQLQIQTENVPPELTAEQWVADFERWAESHRHLPHEADDSRESIYEGRGE